jgi:hypothetical protein
MIVSGSCSEDGRERSEAVGADVYLEKGALDERGLLEAVRQFL